MAIISATRDSPIKAISVREGDPRNERVMKVPEGMLQPTKSLKSALISLWLTNLAKIVQVQREGSERGQAALWMIKRTRAT